MEAPGPVALSPQAPDHPASPLLDKGAAEVALGWMAAHWRNTMAQPLLQPSVICHLLSPEPTANTELATGSWTLSGQDPCGYQLVSCCLDSMLAGSGSIFQHSVGWSNCEAPNTVW